MGTQNVKRDRSQDDLTCDGHLVHELHDDPTGQELAGEVEQVAVVEHDQELGQLPLVRLHGAGVALGGVQAPELGVHDVRLHRVTGRGRGRGRGGANS